MYVDWSWTVPGLAPALRETDGQFLDRQEFLAPAVDGCLNRNLASLSCATRVALNTIRDYGHITAEWATTAQGKQE